MSLLGPELADLRKQCCPNCKFSFPTTIRIGLQLVRALQDVHESGFVHRDVKPSNLAMGYIQSAVLYVFDFGLARQILISDGKGGMKLREARKKSIEQGRQDDLIAGMYSLIECATNVLPWKGKNRKDLEKSKEATSEKELCKGSPSCFVEILNHLKNLKYVDRLDYGNISSLLRRQLPKNIKMTDPYEWSKMVKNGGIIRTPNKHKLEMGKNCDRESLHEMDESIVTEEDGTTVNEEGFNENDDTLAGM